MIATAEIEGRLFSLYDASTGLPIFERRLITQKTITWSPCGRYIALYYASRRLECEIFDVRSLSFTKSITLFVKNVYSPIGIYTDDPSEADRRRIYYDGALQEIEKPRIEIFEWSPDGRKAAISFCDLGKVAIWDIARNTYQDIYCYGLDKKCTINSLKWSICGRYLAINHSYNVNILDYKTGAVIKQFKATGQFTSMCWYGVSLCLSEGKNLLWWKPDTDQSKLMKLIDPGSRFNVSINDCSITTDFRWLCIGLCWVNAVGQPLNYRILKHLNSNGVLKLIKFDLDNGGMRPGRPQICLTRIFENRRNPKQAVLLTLSDPADLVIKRLCYLDTVTKEALPIELMGYINKMI